MAIPVGNDLEIVFYIVLTKTKHLKFKKENYYMNYSTKSIKKQQRGTLDCVIHSLINALHNLEMAYEEAIDEIEILKEKIDHFEEIIKY